MALSAEQKQLAVALNAEGMTNIEIGERLNVNRKTVGNYFAKQGIRSPYVRTRIIDLGGGKVQCTKCGRELPREELPWGRVTTNPYQLSYCRQCLTESAVANTRKSVPQYLKHRQRAIKSRALESGVPYDLPGGYLADLYEKQGRACFYTDEPMQVHFGTRYSGSRRDSLSVDKIVPERGYVVGNVVLCIDRANRIKNDCSLDEMAQWMPGWHARVIALWDELGIPVEVVPGWDAP